MDIDKIVSQMTLEEKADLCSGADFWRTQKIDRLGVLPMMVSDGPHGLRTQCTGKGINQSVVSVCFPSSAGLAASFDKIAAETLGKTLGKEAKEVGVGTLLGPAINIKRSPLCGRNFEYMSEDPCLAGEMAAMYVSGVQSNGVGVSVKHFAANNQETRRTTINEIIDERALREIYLRAFEIPVRKSKPWTMMCSYNRINGIYSSENEWLLKTVLRKEWGFDGFVMSDWGATADRAKGIKAGLDLEMPSSGGVNGARIIKAVQSGELDEKYLDECVRNILSVTTKAVRETEEKNYDREAHHVVAKKIADECMVLLKNDGALPIAEGKKVAFLGYFAKKPRYQGGGSSHINTYKEVSALEAAGGKVVYAQGYTDKHERNEKLLKEAVETAKSADVAVVFAGLPDSFESEGYDRKHMRMPDAHNELISRVAEVNPNTVVVLHNGSPVEMPWIDEVSAVLEAYLGGEAVGETVADVLWGKVNPSGKLPESFPISLADSPCGKYFPGSQLTSLYKESIFVGYRYYSTAGKKVLFPFGHGLSYTEFEYSDLKINHEGEKVCVSLKVKNVGQVFGKEAVQIYVGKPDSAVPRAKRELKAFEKVALKAGEEKTVCFELSERDFAFYSVNAGRYVVEKGEYKVEAAASSEDIRLTGLVALDGETLEKDQTICEKYFAAEVSDLSDEEFAESFGLEIPRAKLDKDEKIDENFCFIDAADTKWGKRVLRLVRFAASFNKDLGGAETMYNMTITTPFRCMRLMSGGVMDERMMRGLIMILNDGTSTLKGFGMIVKSLFGALERIKLCKKNKLRG